MTTPDIQLGTTPWDTSNREALLQGLEAVIKRDMVGVATVRRQSIERECLAEAELPAVLIDELSGSYTWDHRHCAGELRQVSVVVFDLQAKCKRTKQYPLGNVSQAREAMVAALLKALQNNPTLHVQLEGEAAEEAHAVDAFSGAEVRYMKAKHPMIRALVTVRMLTNENFADNVTTDWQQLVLTASPSPNEGDVPLTTTFTLDSQQDGDDNG